MKQEELNRTIPSGGVPLAIIGIGCLFPQAEDRSAYWANIREGVDAITEIPASHWRVADYHDPDPKSPDMTYGHHRGHRHLPAPGTRGSRTGPQGCRLRSRPDL